MWRLRFSTVSIKTHLFHSIPIQRILTLRIDDCTYSKKLVSLSRLQLDQDQGLLSKLNERAMRCWSPLLRVQGLLSPSWGRLKLWWDKAKRKNKSTLWKVFGRIWDWFKTQSNEERKHGPVKQGQISLALTFVHVYVRNEGIDSDAFVFAPCCVNSNKKVTNACKRQNT